MKLNKIIFFIVFLTFLPFITYSAEPPHLSKVIDYLKIVGYEDLITSTYNDCISQSKDMAPDNEKIITSSISVIERKKDLKPGTLIIEKSKFGILIKKLESNYLNYVKESCGLTRQAHQLKTIAVEYAKYVTNEDIDAIIEFAKSPAGKKDIIASKKGIDKAYKIIWASKKEKQLIANNALNERQSNTISEYLIITK